MNTRLGLVEAYRSAEPRLRGMSLERFTELTALFEVHELRANGRTCGALLVLRNEIHACVLPWAKGRWFTRQAAGVLNRVIDQFGEATTTATTEDGRRFVTALGFEPHGEIYRSTKKWALNRSSAQ